MKLSQTAAIMFVSAVAAAALKVKAEAAVTPLMVVSSPATPRVAMAARRTDSQFVCEFEIEPFAGCAPGVQIGAAAAHTIVRDRPDAADQAGRFRFTIAAQELADTDADWQNLRLALVVTWTDIGGVVRRRERYRHLDGRAPHAPLATDPAAWRTLDLAAWQGVVADRLQIVALPIVQPTDGKLSVVIDDSAGNRVRNLTSGQSYAAGRHDVQWDCLDEDGKLVAPGVYRWRSLSHPGIVPEYLMAFANGGEPSLQPFGPNHNIFEATTSNGKLTFLAAPNTEGGESLIAVGADGRTVRAYPKVHGTGMGAVAVAADDTWLYVINDGPGWGQRVDRKGPDWKAEISLSLTRYRIATGQSVDFAERRRFTKPITYEWGPGSSHPALAGSSDFTLRGVAVIGDTLYVSARHAQAIIELDTATGEQRGRIDLAAPGPVASFAGKLYAISGADVIRLDPRDGTPGTAARETVVAACAGQPRGLALDGDGIIYVADGAPHQIRIFAAGGDLIRTLGTPGGPYAGVYDLDRLVNPTGLAVTDDRLWVTEGRRNPKRATMWDLAQGKVRFAKYGNPPYGGPGAAFDPADPRRWVGLRCQWQLDLAKGSAMPVSVLQQADGHLGGLVPFQNNYRFYRRDGRTFLLGMGKINTVSELLPDGSLRDLAFYGSGHLVLYAFGWQRVAAFCSAFEGRYPAADIEKKYSDERWRYAGVLWVDRNGDGLLQEDEFDIADGNYRFGNGWGDQRSDLTIRLVVDEVDPASRTVLNQRLVTLVPDGFNEAGAPRYGELGSALARSVVMTGLPAFAVRPRHSPLLADSHHNLLSLSDPMVAISPDGRCLWRCANPWTGVHGSHNAPLPQVGVMQGTLFFLGSAPLDALSDVFMLNGNHGRFFCLTSDGIYLDEMFHDVRLGAPRDAFYVGGEPFGGHFGSSDGDGSYILQTGGNGYRVYRLSGLDRVTRGAGTITVSAAQVTAAERRQVRRQAAEAVAKETVVPAAHAAVDVRSGDWTAEWGEGALSAQARLAFDATNLYLHYQVRDASPWRNNGRDWQTLFKTGDSIDLQLGTDPTAKPGRAQPVPGDLRLLIAPFGGEPVAVLYRHRLAAAPRTPVTFSSPWRSEIVDEVRRLDDVGIEVETRGDGYAVTAAIPLTELGLSQLAGQTLAGDLGVLHGDADGTATGLRSYWSSRATGLVSDVPGEIMLHPNLWGTLRFSSALAAEPESESRAQTASIRCAGIVANSGESGPGLVRMAADGPTRGIGVVCDRHGCLWDRAGQGQLNRYAADGRLVAAYPIDGREDHRDMISLVGDTLVLRLRGRLYTLGIDAAPGTEPRPLDLPVVDCLSSGSRDGCLVIAQTVGEKQSRLSWLDPISGSATPICDLPWGGLAAVAVAADGTVYFEADRMMHKVVAGKWVESWQREAPGERPQLIDGAWFGHAWHGTVRRFNSVLQPDPGVVLGGASGSFIGHLAQNSELQNGRGLCRVGAELYAISGIDGVMHLMHWDAQARAMSLVRRIGALRDIRGLGLDHEGRIFARNGCWLWDDGPEAPQRLGMTTSQTTQCVMLPNDYVLAFGRRYGWPGHPTFVIGPLNQEVATNGPAGEAGWDMLGLDRNRHYLGAACYRAAPGGQGPAVLLLMDDHNVGHAFRVEPNDWRNCYRANLGEVRLTTDRPVEAFRTLAMQDAETLLAAADGVVIRFVRNDRDWQEADRFAGGDDPFGGQLDIACDAGHLWVADSERHRVLCFDAESRVLLAAYGRTDRPGPGLDELNRPTTLAARGHRCVLFDSGNQRLVKLELTGE